MNKIVITSSEEFEGVITALEASLVKVRDIFDIEEKDYKRIDGTDTWTGASQQVISVKLNELSKNYEPICYSLDLYIRFLKKTLADYKAMDEAINRNAEEMTQQLDVNS